MRRLPVISWYLVLFVLVLTPSLSGGSNSSISISKKNAACLKTAYPIHVSKIHYFPSGMPKSVEMKDNTTIAWGNIKHITTYDELLNTGQLKDVFYVSYKKGNTYLPLKKNEDPGRVRSYEFLNAVYGNTKREIKSNLVNVKWAPSKQTVRFNKQNGAANALQKVGEELAFLPAKFQKYISKIGTFNYRKIAGTNRLSAHSYGIAVDINTKYSDYWRWSKGKTSLQYKNKIPYEIVRVFEKHGFIWGGKWYHYDTMHFEYRPEFFCE